MQPGIASASARLQNDFLSLRHVSDVRQWGYMIGIELVLDKASRKNYAPELRIGHKVNLEARKRGVLIRPLGDIIILMPPLTISARELATLLDVVYDSIRVVTEGPAAST
jgi:adenosylmethionine-8-amino-7-oxononanoate aminotransferase